MKRYGNRSFFVLTQPLSYKLQYLAALVNRVAYHGCKPPIPDHNSQDMICQLSAIASAHK